MMIMCCCNHRVKCSHWYRDRCHSGCGRIGISGSGHYSDNSGYDEEEEAASNSDGHQQDDRIREEELSLYQHHSL